MALPHTVIIADGRAYRIPRAPHETEDRAQERAWHVANAMRDAPAEAAPDRVLCESHMAINKKYLGVAYSPPTSAADSSAAS